MNTTSTTLWTRIRRLLRFWPDAVGALLLAGIVTSSVLSKLGLLVPTRALVAATVCWVALGVHIFSTGVVRRRFKDVPLRIQTGVVQLLGLAASAGIAWLLTAGMREWLPQVGALMLPPALGLLIRRYVAGRRNQVGMLVISQLAVAVAVVNLPSHNDLPGLLVAFAACISAGLLANDIALVFVENGDLTPNENVLHRVHDNLVDAKFDRDLRAYQRSRGRSPAPVRGRHWAAQARI